MNERSSNIRFIILAAGLIVADQITKVLIKGFSLFGFEHAGIHQKLTVIDGFFWITYVENAGMAFGIQFGEAKIILSLFSVVASVALTWYLLVVRTDRFWVKFGLALLLAGATGNLIDRVFYGVFYGEAPLFFGKVVDFIEVEFFDFTLFGKSFTTWPVFNIADSCVTCGMAILLLNHRHLPFGDKPDQGATDDDAAAAVAEAGTPEAETEQPENGLSGNAAPPARGAAPGVNGSNE